MPPPKKAAKKSAKKAAKKHSGKHHEAGDLRRVYEHLNRVEVLRPLLAASFAEAATELAKLAQQLIQSGYRKDAADALRASEHLSFASLAGNALLDMKLSPELEQAIAGQHEDLLRRAEEHWTDQTAHPALVKAIYDGARKGAARALKQKAYAQALEFARAAEALAHVNGHGPKELGTGGQRLKLEAA
jgi:hypothetical protein